LFGDQPELITLASRGCFSSAGLFGSSYKGTGFGSYSIFIFFFWASKSSLSFVFLISSWSTRGFCCSSFSGIIASGLLPIISSLISFTTFVYHFFL